MVIHNDEIKKIQKTVFDLIKDGDFEPAMGLIQTLLEQDPNDAVALNFLGIIHLEMKNFHLAYQYFRRALQENPKLAPVWGNFGLSAHELGRNDEAINAYMKSAECDNEYIKAYVNSAAVFIEEARWDDAEKACNNAVSALGMRPFSRASATGIATGPV
jgi:tetratricopeptide (TPR) repeat protein